MNHFSFKCWTLELDTANAAGFACCCNAEHPSNKANVYFHRSVAQIGPRPLTMKRRLRELTLKVDTVDEPFSEYVLGKRTFWDLETQEMCLRALTVQCNDSYHFAFKGVKYVSWLSPQ